MRGTGANRLDRQLLTAIGLLILSTLPAVLRAQTLSADQVVEDRIAAGATQEFTVTLPAGRVATLTLVQTDQPLELRGYPNAAAPALRPAGGRGSRLRLTLIAGATPQPLHLTLAAVDTKRETALQIELGRLRPIGPASRHGIAGEAALAQAEALRRGGDKARTVDARSAYATARKELGDAGDGCNLRVAALGSGRLEYAAGDYRAAVRGGKAAVASACPDDRADLAKAHHLIGVSESALGDSAAAAMAEERALALHRELADPVNEAITLGNLGTMYRVLGETGKALAAAKDALALAQKIGDRERIAFVRDSLAGLYLARGELATALDTHRQTLVDLEGISFPLVEGNARLNLGITMYRLGDHDAALDSWAEGEKVCTASDNTACLVAISASRGDLYRDESRCEEAALEYERGLRLAEEKKLSREAAYIEVGLGTCAIIRGDVETARRRIDHAIGVYRSLRASEEVYALIALGDLDQKAGRAAASRASYDRALALSERQLERNAEVRSLASLARLDFAEGRLTRAGMRVERALKRIETERARINEPALRTRFFDSSRAYYELLIEIRMAQHRLAPQAGHAAEALVVAERARARSLSEQLAQRRVTPERAAAEPLLVERDVATDRVQAIGYALTRVATGAASERARLQRELDTASRALDTVRGRLRATEPRYAEAADPRPLTLAEVQKRWLDDDSALLEFWLGDAHSYLWLVTREGLHSYVLLPRAQIETLARQLREAVSHPVPELPLEKRAAAEATKLAELRTLGAELNAQLLAPAAADIGNRRRVIVADGELQRLSFGLLRPIDSGNATRQPATVYLPSIQTLRWLRTETVSPRRPLALAVFADPVFSGDDPRLPGRTQVASAEQHRAVNRAAENVGVAGLPRLRHSRDEAQMLAELAPGSASLVALDFAANRETALKTDWSRFGIVHFATHTLLDLKRPELSGVVLSLYDHNGAPQDGFLRMNDLYNLRMPADLVVLSACESALGKTEGAEGVFNLARAFFYAGTRRVLASLWNVDDRASAEFMAHFYRALLKDGDSPDEALREAQKAFAEDPRWSAPYYWAGYVLQGDWRDAAR